MYTNAEQKPTSSDDVMTRYKGKMMSRGEANALRAEDPDAIQITPVGSPAVVKDQTNPRKEKTN